MHVMMVTPQEYRLFNKCASYLKKNFSIEEMSDPQTKLGLLKNYMREKDMQLSGDDIASILLLARGEIKIKVKGIKKNV